MTIIRYKYICLIFLLFNNAKYVFSQVKIEYSVLDSYVPDLSFGDLKILDERLKTSKLIGAGESTHGTREFSLFRHKLFKYLVIHHGYNTIFLEADFSSCLDINNYINGHDIDLHGAIRAISMWPWMTEEMKQLFIWMREYNSSTEYDQKLRIIGCDLQRINSTIEKIDTLIAKYDRSLIDTTYYQDVPKNDFFSIEQDDLYSKLNGIANNKSRTLKVMRLKEDDEFEYTTLLRHLNQIIEEKVNQKFGSYRDVKMGENILYHLNKDKSIKGLYWAHNWHVCNIYKPKRNQSNSIVTAGGVLKNNLQSGYFIVGQDFIRGSFNVYHPTSKKANQNDLSGYELGDIHLESEEGYFGYEFRNLEGSLFLINFLKVDFKNIKGLLFHGIGADYNRNINRGFIIEEDMFDIMVIIKNTSATNLLH